MRLTGQAKCTNFPCDDARQLLTVPSVGPIWIALISVCLILTVTEIVLLARKKLKPLAFLITNALKSAIFLALFIIDIVSTVNSEEHTASAIALVIEAALL